MTGAAEPTVGALPAMDRRARLAGARQRIESEGCDSLLVTNPVNIRYLTGFTGSAGLLLVGSDTLVLTTDGRYEAQAAEELDGAGVDARIEVGNGARQREVVAEAANSMARIALEAGHVTWARQRALASSWFAGSEVVATEGLVEGLREVKDEGEVARIGAAARIADRALAEVRAALVPGVSEADLALALDTEMRRLGSEGLAFPTIVASGPNSARPHARPSDRPIAASEPVVMDFGAVVDGYRSDMTRTVCLGPPDGSLEHMAQVVAAAHRAGVAAVANGRPASEVDRACREVIDQAGWGKAFVHGTGHGVGLDIHEAPAVAATSAATLSAGQVVTVEPGVYLASHGGVRIEDTVLVTGEGSRPLTSAGKDLVIPI